MMITLTAVSVLRIRSYAHQINDNIHVNTKRLLELEGLFGQACSFFLSLFFIFIFISNFNLEGQMLFGEHL